MNRAQVLLLLQVTLIPLLEGIVKLLTQDNKYLKMKKLLFTLLVSLPIVSFAQEIPFKVTSNLELVWSKEYDGELNITSGQNNQGIDGVFDIEKKKKVVSIIVQINYNAIA